MKNSPQQMSHNSSPTLTIALLVASIGLVLIAFFVGMYWAGQQPELVQTVPVYPDQQDTQNVTDDEVLVEIDPSISNSDGLLIVDWLSLDEQSRTLPLTAFDALVQEPWGTVEGPDAFRLGTVTGGDYDGYELSYQQIAISSMGTWTYGLYVLQDRAAQEKPIVLDRYGSEGGGFGNTPFTQGSVIASLLESLSYRGDFATALSAEVDFDTTASIPEFDDDSDQIDSAGRRYILNGLWGRADDLIGYDLNHYPVVSLVQEGTMRMIPVPDDGDLTTIRSHFFTQREDGRLLIYDLDYSFWDEEGDASQVPDVRLSDGTSMNEAYLRGGLGGCGIYPDTNVIDINDIGGTVAVGTTNAGATIYKAADYSVAYFDGRRASWAYQNLRDAYEDVTSEAAKQAAIEAFSAMSPPPTFYYKDTFNRWVEFTNASLTAGVECGKPVIYLYPEEEMSLEVHVDPKGGFSYTDPVYNNGWRVSTTTDSVITNLDDGQVYPYLFWEGRGGAYTAPEQYWVVSRDDVPRFLAKTLRQIGFEGREVADFMEFWVPRMQASPYYKVGFHGTGVMDELAPLTLSVEPDSVLRVLMDFAELDAPVVSNPPRIPPFERTGFTVTEWGGVLR